MAEVPAEVHRILEAYFALLEAGLPGRLEAFYLTGSVSLGAYCPGRSDVDFVAVMAAPAAEAELNALKRIHRAVKKRFPRTDLMGLYVTEGDLRAQRPGGRTCPRFGDGRFKGFDRFDPDSVDGYQLLTYGIAVRGRPVGEYGYRVRWDVLLQKMMDNLNSYWRRWRQRCAMPSSPWFWALLFRPGAVEWGVLGVSRLYYTLREGGVISKTGAGEYARNAVPARWHKILREAAGVRRGAKGSAYRSGWQRRGDALAYVDYCIAQCNALYAHGGAAPPPDPAARP